MCEVAVAYDASRWIPLGLCGERMPEVGVVEYLAQRLVVSFRVFGSEAIETRCGGIRWWYRVACGCCSGGDGTIESPLYLGMLEAARTYPGRGFRARKTFEHC